MPNINLTGWKLQTPIDRGDGYALEGSPAQNYLPYYRIYETNMQFMCPETGALTSGATSPRTEMGQTSAYLWKKGKFTMHATVRQSEGRFTLHQIFHPTNSGGPTNGPPIRVMHDISVQKFYYLSRTPEGVDKRTDFSFCPALGEAFMLQSKLDGTSFSLKLLCGFNNEIRTETISAGWGGKGYSFKFGVYRGPAYMHVHDATWSCSN